jgi:hypothetical protein
MTKRRHKLKLVEMPKPAPRMPATITVTAANRGQTLGTSGVLQAIRFRTPPSSRSYGEIFQLLDGSRSVYCIDPTTNPICIPAGSATLSNELMRSDIPFSALVLAQIPTGSSWELDLA